MVSSMKKALALTGAAAMLLSMAACGGDNAGDDSGVKEITFQTWNLKNDKYTPYFRRPDRGVTRRSIRTSRSTGPTSPPTAMRTSCPTQAASGELPDIVDGGASILYGLARPAR